MGYVGGLVQKPSPQYDLAVLAQARPYIRTIAAFLIYLRYGDDVNGYQMADEFIDQLKQDMGGKG